MSIPGTRDFHHGLLGSFMRMQCWSAARVVACYCQKDSSFEDCKVFTAIYGIKEAEGTRALVLELVEGPTLADRIAQGPIPKAASSRHQPLTSDPELRLSANNNLVIFALPE